MSYDPRFEPYPPRHRAGPRFGSVLWLALLGVGLYWAYTHFIQRGPLFDPDANPRPVQARGDLASDEKSTIDLFKQASPSVVFITSLAVQRDRFSLDIHQIPRGSGTGFVWDADGHVVTNVHVVQGGQAFKVTLADRSEWDATLVNGAPDYDLAVLKVAAPKDRLPVLPIGTSADLQVGQKVFAIGNPFGLDQSLTTGVVSALGREIKSQTDLPITGVIQTDAAINPGNSGGPLLDSAGRLIGVNTAIATQTGTYSGIGFAIPVDTVNAVVPQLIRNRRPNIGATFLEDSVARRLGVGNGVLVREVTGKIGLRATVMDRSGRIVIGDIVVGINGQPVKRRADLEAVIARAKAGDVLTFTVVRQRQEIEVTGSVQES